MPMPRKPHQLKVVAGTDRKDRPEPELIDLPLFDETPPAPDWLPNQSAIDEWNRLAPILQANKLLTQGGLSSLGMLCALHGKIVQLYKAGETPMGNMIQQYRALTNDFGLTPVAQGKVKPVGDAKPKNAFAGNGRPKSVAA